MSVLDVPKEVLKIHLFSQLDERDLIKVGMVNKYFAELVNDENFWKEKCRSLFDINSKSELNKKKKKTNPKTPAKKRKTKKEPPETLWRTIFVQKSKNRCIHHIKEIGKQKEPFFHIHLCEDCRKNDFRYRMITKTRAISEYKINEKILYDSDIYMLECRNPHYRSASPMVLFLEKQVEELAIKTFGSREGLEEQRMKSQRRREKLLATKKRKAEEKMTMKEKRKKVLVKALKEKGLELRSDSVLCSNYMEGCNEIPLEEIVKTMKKMKILYEELDLGEKWEEMYEEEIQGNGYDREEIRECYEDLKDHLWAEYKRSKKRKRAE